MSGGLLAAPFPGAAQAFVFEWARTLELLAAEKPAWTVPAHGPVQRGATSLALLADMMNHLIAAARRSFANGHPAADAVARLETTHVAARLSGDDTVTRRAFRRFFLGPAVESVYRQLRERGGGG